MRGSRIGSRLWLRDARAPAVANIFAELLPSGASLLGLPRAQAAGAGGAPGSRKGRSVLSLLIFFLGSEGGDTAPFYSSIPNESWWSVGVSEHFACLLSIFQLPISPRASLLWYGAKKSLGTSPDPQMWSGYVGGEEG